MNKYIKNGEILSMCSQDIEQKLAQIKGYNSGTNLRKMICSNANLDLVNMNAYIKFGETLSIRFGDIEWKRNSDPN